MSKPFKGKINVDIRDSVPGWEPFEPPKAPDGAANVLYIVLDDVGFSAMSCYGGPIETPNIDRIANAGVRYTQWHTTALCSPTRSCLLTGRNHTRNSMACITEAAVGFPNASGTIPPENGMISEILGEQGWNTYITGKWHLCPTVEMNLASTRRNWPSGRGFERFYGLLGAETNQWYPELVYDNHPVDPPKPPEEGYHLTADLTDKALEFIKDARAVAPDKPSFLYYAPGAAHAPHHVSKEWADKFKGQFDMGYEAMPEQTLAWQKEMGIVPADTGLPPGNTIGTAETRHGPDGQPFPPLDVTRPWDSLSAGDKRLFSRMAEVYAGFLARARTPWSSWCRTTGRAARAARTGRSTRCCSPTVSRTACRPTWPCSTSWAGPRLITTTPTAGRWRSTRRSRCGSGTSSTAAPPTRASSPGPRPEPKAAGGAEITVAERLVVHVSLDPAADAVAGVQAGLHRHLGDAGQLVQAHHVAQDGDLGMAGDRQAFSTRMRPDRSHLAPVAAARAAATGGASTPAVHSTVLAS